MNGKESCETYSQPRVWEKIAADGVFIKEVNLPTQYSIVPQHAHAYEHTTLVASGKLMVFDETGKHAVYEAPSAVYIPAGVKHMLMSLVADTVAYCIHNISRHGTVDIADENSIDNWEHVSL